MIELSDEQRAIRDTVRSFARQEIAPLAPQIDEHDTYPSEVVQRIGQLGVLGLGLPEEWRSGLGDLGQGDAISATIACEEIAWASAAVGNIVSAIRICVFALDRFGSDAAKHRWLPPLLRGERTVAFAVTEPGAGSDLASLATSARRDGGDYVLDGAKWPITFAPIADAFLVLCTLDPSLGTRGMTMLLVERDRPGVTIGPPERKLGQLGNPLGGVTFEGVRVPRENLLGEEGQGFKIAMASLDVTRIDVASIALGLSRAAFDAARAHAQERVQFGKPIAELQAVQFMLAEMATEIEAGQWLTWRAATVRDQGVRFTREAAMAKLFCSDNCMKHTTNAVQILGGRGYLKGYDVERYFRDAKVTQIYDGTSEIQKVVIARHVLADSTVSS
ncbi:MAG: acyl-CoA dehydrogenase family protein [Thermomicrobiales bacterium]